MRLLTCAATHCMLTMPQKHISLQDFPLPPCRKTPPHGSNGRYSAYSCASQKILRESSTHSHSSGFLWNRYRQESSPPMETPFRSKVWNNTSAPWGRYLRQWGPQTLDSTPWEASTLVWDGNLRPMRGKTPPPH